MKVLRVTLALGLLAGLLAQAAFVLSGPVHASCGPGPGYYVASLKADIDPGSADFLSSAVSNAKAACEGNMVFVLQTNGGDGGSMESMIGTISDYRSWGGTFITLVAPPGGFAFSAGSYIAQASNRIYMAHGTTIGSATPIVSGIPTGEENSTLRKDISAFASYMQTLTESNGRNYSATRLMVTQGVSYTDLEAVRYHVVDGSVNSTSLEGALQELGVPASTPIDTPGVRSTVISVLSDPNVSGLLFLIGVFAILADIYHPTLVLTVVGGVLIALALFGLGAFGASPLAVLLMIIGAAFIFLEVKTQHGVSAVIGVIIFIVGFLLVFQFPPSSPSNPSLPPVNFTGVPVISYALLTALGVGIVVASLYLRSIREGLMKRPKVNDPSQAVGKVGRMETDFVPGGKGVATVGAEQWTVTSVQELKKGDAVKVKEVKGLELVVEKQN
ncbi:MAG: nodulation protein NfeD [Thaumarchaeota archaeon]|nr:nodulation protein NfeD [Nitrososphaerota archaeon]